MRDLFRGYNKLIRPVQNMTQKVEVAFGLAFIQLINVVSLQKQQHTLYNAILRIARNFLETRVIIKILIHPGWPRKFD